MAQASRSKGKARPRSRSTNGAHETATPARDYSIAAVGRALDLLEALSRIGPAPLAALAESARCTRTAGFCCPPICTCATPGIWEICCARIFSA